jgi:hypothetical protein
MSTLKRWWAIVLLSLAIGLIAVPLTYGVTAEAKDKGKESPRERTERSVAFREDMRELWEEHIVWTREYIVSFAADADDQDEVATRLLANQDHIGDAIKPFYGEEAGEQLTALLKEHILGAVTLLQAAKAGDTAAFDAANAAWYANGSEIAQFLNAANPENWRLAETTHHMTTHLDLTLQEAANRLGGNFAADIADYDAVHDAILEMADMLSLGIINQFPKQFK